MVMIKIKGNKINVVLIRDSFNRRAQKFKNNIISSLRAISINKDDIEIKLEPIAIKNIAAKASWYIDGFHLHYSYKACNKYVENLYVISKLIELEVNAITNGEKTMNQFIRDFNEGHDVEEERKDAREFLGVDSETLDLEIINKKYKSIAKDLHPDMPNGNTEKFKTLNHAHKILKRELE